MPKKRIRTVYLVYKRSMYQRFFLDERHAGFRKLFAKRHPSIKSVRHTHDTHMDAVRSVQKYLTKLGIELRTESRHRLKRLSSIDLVITLGGDGTFLRTAHFAKDQLILPVNSDPMQSVGALCSTDAARFAEKFDTILAGKFQAKKLPLIRIRVNGKALPVEAVNDILFTNISPAATSRYRLKLGRETEEQKSSGLWVSTATGLTAAIHAAGGVKMKPGDRRLQFATREPYQGNFNPYGLTHGFIPPGKKIALTNLMVRAKIYVDGPTNSFDLDYGDEMECALSGKTLKVIS